jgi:hypothetical protein
VGKSLRRAGSRERKRRIDPSKASTKRHFIGADQAIHKNKKDVKMKDGPDKLMKTKGQISDKMAEATKHLKTK